MLATVLSCGCSTTATLRHANGADTEAYILGGTRNDIIVRGDNGDVYAIPRSDVRSIDHPGNIHAVFGGVLFAYGVANIVIGLPQCRDAKAFASGAEQGGYCTGVFAPAAVGAGVGIWGGVVYARSEAAAGDTSSELPRQPIEFPPGHALLVPVDAISAPLRVQSPVIRW